MRKITVLLALLLSSSAAIAGGVPYPSNINSMPGSGLTSNHFILGDTIQGLKDSGYTTVPCASGGTGITSGTSGGVLYFSGSCTLLSSTLLTSHGLVLGGGAGAAPHALTDLGTTSKLLCGNAAGDPTWCSAIPVSTWGPLTGDVTTSAYVSTIAAIQGVTVTGNTGTGKVVRDTNPVILFPAGTSTVPGVQVGSTNSGWYNDGADNLCATAGARTLGCFNHVTSTAGIIFGTNAANTVPTSIGGAMTGIENIGTGNTYGHYRQILLSNNANPSQIACAKSRSATNGTFVAIQSGDSICQFLAVGDDGATYDTVGGAIRFVAAANWTTGNGPTDTLFNMMDSGGSLRQVLCLDGNTGLWLGVNGTGAKCGTTGTNFLDRSDNATFASEVVGTPTGGNEGAGSINATTIYRNGVALAAIATSGSATDLLTGTIPSARLPGPGPAALGGITSASCASATDYSFGYDTLGVVRCRTPQWADLAGSIPNGTVSAPSLPFNTNYGFYYDPSLSSLDLSIAGSQIWTMSATGLIQSIAGGGTSSINILGEGTTQQNFSRYTNDANAPSFTLAKGRGTIASRSVPVLNDTLGNFSFSGQNGLPGLTAGARISATLVETGTVGLTSMGTKLSFSTDPIGSGTLGEIFNITSDSGLTLDKDLTTNGATVTISSCGVTPGLVSGSSDLAGEVAEGTAAVGCIISFSATKSLTPFCTVTTQSQLTSFAYTITTTGIAVTNTSSSGDKIDWTCIQPKH